MRQAFPEGCDRNLHPREDYERLIEFLQDYNPPAILPIQIAYYAGLRVIKGFMISGGDPEGTGMGGPGYGIKGEFAQNGVKNDLRHTVGVLSMARSMMPDSAGSQFFIMHKDAPHLDGAYAAFGKIIEGQDVVDAIAETATDYSDRPLGTRVDLALPVPPMIPTV